MTVGMLWRLRSKTLVQTMRKMLPNGTHSHTSLHTWTSTPRGKITPVCGKIKDRFLHPHQPQWAPQGETTAWFSFAHPERPDLLSQCRRPARGLWSGYTSVGSESCTGLDVQREEFYPSIYKLCPGSLRASRGLGKTAQKEPFLCCAQSMVLRAVFAAPTPLSHREGAELCIRDADRPGVQLCQCPAHLLWRGCTECLPWVNYEHI